MPRMRHGYTLSLEHIRVAEFTGDPNDGLDLSVMPVSVSRMHRFGYLFPELQQKAGSLLPEDPKTVENLKLLGQSMQGPSSGEALDSNIPASYVYFGQFIDHEITFEAMSSELATICDPNLKPLSLCDIQNKIKNVRSSCLDLDSVYCKPAKRNGEEMEVGEVSFTPAGYPRGRSEDEDKEHNDLPRQKRSDDRRQDRAARIGDPRNDENLITAQLHVAFLRAHNALVCKKGTFQKAREVLRHHYQWLVIEDFLKRIVDPLIVQAVLDTKCPRFNPPDDDFFMPLEFTVAAYRFGHSMVRTNYDYNSEFNPASLQELFSFTALSGQLGNSPLGQPKNVDQNDTLPSNWIIEWQRFIEGGALTNRARRITTSLVEPLFSLRDEVGEPLPDEARLAVRNLLRGYLMRLPTGQAVACALGQQPLSPTEIESVAANSVQRDVLQKTGFSTDTPLWFYILAEAAYYNKEHLGPVGSRLVAEVLIGLMRRTPNSILSMPGWMPDPELCSTPGKFTLPDLLRLAGVLS